MYEGDSIWSRKGATMSDKSARTEFGLTQQEIVAAIRAGKLQPGDIYGDPWYYANTRSEAVPSGFSQEETIKAIWSEK